MSSVPSGGRFRELSFLAKHSVIYGIGNTLSRIVAFLMLPIYTRHLTPFDYGVLEIVDTSTAMVGLVAGLGVTGAMTRFYYDYADDADRRAVVSTTFMLTGVAVALILLILLPLTPGMTRALFQRTDLSTTLAIALIGLGIGLFVDVAQVYLRIRQQSLAYVAVSLGNLLVGVALNVYFVVFEQTGVIGIFYASLGAKLAVGLPLAMFVLIKVGLRFQKELAVRMCRYSLPLIPSDLANTAVGYSDRFFINHFLSTADAGIYGLAQKLGTVVHVLITSPFLMTYLPRRFEIAKNPEAPRTFASIFDYHILLLVFVSTGLTVFAPEVMALMTTPPYYPAAQLIPLIALSMVILGMKYHFQFGILYRNQTKYMMYINLATAVLHVALNALLIPLFGLWGALVAFALAVLANSSVSLVVGRRLYAIAFDFSRTARLGALAIAVCACALAVGGGTWTQAGVKLLLLLLLPAAVLALGVVPKSEWTRIGEVARRLTGSSGTVH